MEFQPLYYKTKPSSPAEPYDKEKLNIVNPNGQAGIVTLWTKPWEVWNQIQKRAPALLEKDSPLVTLTSLYGNGLPQMLSNLANNPQIQFLAVTGKDTPAVPSYTYLKNFLEQGIENGRIAGTQFPLNSQLTPEIFKNLRVERFSLENLEALVNFMSQQPKPVSEADRKPIYLQEPEFKDFPSDITSHQISAETPTKAWMELMYRINRFGKDIIIEKGKRRALFNLSVNIANPSPEGEEELKRLGFDLKELQAYREGIIRPELPQGVSYTYGNRMRSYFGIDSLETIVQRLKKDPKDRRCFLTTWDNLTDLDPKDRSDGSAPCLTSIYFVKDEDKLRLSADFRTHNAVSAWLLNQYGLRAIQEYVAKETGIPEGSMNVRSRWIGIDPEDARTNSSLELIKSSRTTPIDITDPRGYLVFSTGEGKIIAEHYAQSGEKLTTYQGATAKEVKDKLREVSAFDNPDHSVWIGYELARAHHKLYGEIPII